MRRFQQLLLAALVCLGGSIPAEAQPEEGLFLSAYFVNITQPLGGPTSQKVSVQVTTFPSGLKFVVTGGNVSWVSVDSREGRTPGAISMTVDLSTFAVGETRQVLIDFTEDEDVGFDHPIFNKELRISATLSAGGPAPIPLSIPQALQFEDSSGGFEILTQELEVINTGDGGFNYQFRIDYPQQGPMGWLFVDPPSGSVTDQSASHVVTANLVGQPKGTYQAVLSIDHNAPNEPSRNIPVTAVIAGPPSFSIAPGSIEAVGRRGKQDPAPATLTMGNSGGGTINYILSTDAAWLSVSPTSGSVSLDADVDHELSFQGAKELPVGTYPATISVLAQTGGSPTPQMSIPVELVVEPGGTLAATPDEVELTMAPRSTETQRAAISITSPELDGLDWKASVQPPTITWLRLKSSSGKLPAQLIVEAETSTIPRPVRLSAVILVEATEPTAALSPTGKQQNAAVLARIPVRINAADREATLTASPSAMRFVVRPGEAGPREQPLSIGFGAGAPVPTWNAEAESYRGKDWLNVAPTVGLGAGVVGVSVSPGGLAPGVYQGAVAVSAGSERQSTHVSMLVLESGQVVAAAGGAGVTLHGSKGVAERTLRVVDLAEGNLDWTAEATTLTGGAWLQADRTASGGLRIRADAESTTAGVRHGLVELNSARADNSPQYVTVVFEKRASDTALELDPGGLVFVSSGGATPPPQTLLATVAAAESTELQAGASTDDGGEWLSVSPELGSASAAGPWVLSVAADPSGLAPGFYRGQVGLAGLSGVFRAASVTLIVAPAGACQASSMVVAPTWPAQGFAAIEGRPLTAAAELRDNCGARADDGGIVLLTGDGSQALTRLGSGRYSATWTPLDSADPAELRFVASADSLGSDETSLLGAVAADESAGPWIAPPVHGATFRPGQALAPGVITSIFGLGLSSDSEAAASLPLPLQMGGLTLRIAGQNAPMYFVSPGQANIQTPYEAPSNSLTQVLAQVDNRYAPPQTFLAAESQPGLFELDAALDGPGRAIVLNEGTALNTSANPAARGSVIVVYLTGQGNAEPAVASGAAGPSQEPLGRVAYSATAAIGGEPAEILFLGLAPGFVGLTQANLRVAEHAPVGASVELEIEIAGQATRKLAIAIGP